MNQQLLYKTPRQIAEENKIYKENYSKGLHYPKTLKDKLYNEPKYDLSEFKAKFKQSLNRGFMSAKQDSINLQNQILYGHKDSKLNAGFNFYNPGFLGSLGAAAVGGWVELDRTTLGSAATSISVSSLANKRYYMILTNVLGKNNAGVNGVMRLGNSTLDSGSNYAFRYSGNGATDATGASQTTMQLQSNPTDKPDFSVQYIANLSAKEKFWQAHLVNQEAAGAGTSTERNESTAKWVNVSNPTDIIGLITNTAFTFNSGSEVVVLGWDPVDIHTTNFWEELASVDLSGGATNTLSTGTFTAKKYLWVQIYTNVDGTTATNPEIRLNSDSGSNYARRASSQGSADGTSVSQTQMAYITQGTAIPTFANMFIINNTANEKLITLHSTEGNTAGAGNAPFRMEAVYKWANTSNQITEVEINQNTSISSNNFGTETTIKVWGSN